MIPRCKYCKREVKDYETLKKSVKWDSTGEYAHSKCFINSGDREREIRRAALSKMIDAINALKGK